MTRFLEQLRIGLGYTHLVYLGLLPSVATFSLLYSYGIAVPLVLFIGGTIAVAVYVAVLFSYTAISRSLIWSILILIDGPIWVLLSLQSNRGSIFAFAIESFLVDGTAIWVAILILAIKSPLPTRQQRSWSIVFMLAAFATTGWMVWPYYRDYLLSEPRAQIFLAVGVVEALVVYYKVLKRDEVVRDTNTTAVFIVVLLLIWVAALILGNVLHERATGTQSYRSCLIQRPKL